MISLLLRVSLGTVARKQGEATRERSLFEESLSIYRVLEDPSLTAALLLLVAAAAVHQSDLASAAALYQESLILHQQQRDRRGTARSLAGLADVARRQRDPLRLQALR